MNKWGDTKSLGPKKRYSLTAVCSECEYQVEREVEVEQINLLSEQAVFIDEAARLHQPHPDLTCFRIVVAEL